MSTPNYFGTLFGAISNPLGTAVNVGRDILNPNTDFIPGVSSPIHTSPLTQYYPNGVPTAINQNVAKSGANTGAAPTDSGAYDYGNASTLGASTSRPSYDPAVLDQLNQTESILNNSLGRLDNQFAIAQGNINGQYDNQLRDLNTQKGNAQSSYNTSSTQNSQNLRTNKNTITDQASNGLRGLMRMLGAYGAAGSSDARVAGQAVADQASQQRAGAGQTFAENQSGLDTNWNNYQSAFDSNKRGLDDWKQNNLNQVQSQSLSQRQSLLSQLADARGQRAALLGGSYMGTAQPYLDQANSLSGQIDSLGRQVQSYTGAAPTYQAKDLSSYDTGSGTAAAIANPDAGVGLNTPYLSLLLGRDKNKQSILR